MSAALRVGDLSRAELGERLAGPGVVLAIPPFNVHLRSPIPVVADGVHRLYAAHAVLDATEAFCDFHIGLVPRRGWSGALCELDVDGMRPFTPLARGEAFALFEWGLNWCVTSHCHGWITIHAAVLERDGLAVLLPGPPGSGKSTLCAWLMHQGWRLLSDELALIDPGHGGLTASPRPISLKNRSIEVISQRVPGAVIGPVAHDTAKGMVAHLQASPDSLARAHERATPRWIVLPRFSAGASLTTEALDRPTALVEFTSNSFNYHVHGPQGFERLAATVEACDTLRLSYGDLDEAAAWFDALVQAQRRAAVDEGAGA
ncbi:HprK-related kinase A [Hydrogenophaga crocea]|uniref:HprK-related kinase A n=1 Tax=Hydrogenophaga crocea TaxID=2716225 RepID=A0A6G8IFG5_9BURK|nr:HprK-related kinase A [Hydrogenophaga crocea]QIM51912.1 HprK-related kinase A [Hydrogenophaga crocea]